jgi:hypothetical protein
VRFIKPAAENRESFLLLGVRLAVHLAANGKSAVRDSY